ncbi:hypothetical protein D3C76_1114730 [compost metagenome]
MAGLSRLRASIQLPPRPFCMSPLTQPCFFFGLRSESARYCLLTRRSANAMLSARFAAGVRASSNSPEVILSNRCTG